MENQRKKDKKDKKKGKLHKEKKKSRKKKISIDVFKQVHEEMNKENQFIKKEYNSDTCDEILEKCRKLSVTEPNHKKMDHEFQMDMAKYELLSITKAPGIEILAYKFDRIWGIPPPDFSKRE